MKQFIEWIPEYSIGIQEIDKQHKEFVLIMNELYEVAGSNNPDEDRLRHIISQLLAYSKYHFATEEKFFDMYDYKYTKEHKKVHHDLIKDVENFPIKDYPTLKEASQALLEFLEIWLIQHLIYEDRKYISCFKANGHK